MGTRIILLALTMLLTTGQAKAADDYKQSAEYLALRDSMHHAFNDADSARFFPALKNLEDYLLKQGDLHAYYTQRCNEIVFQINRQNIYEAYILGRNLSMELREKKLDKEMYMAYNMLGHLNRYCGNKEAAKRNFRYVIDQMEKYGYYESIPPIYMNLVNVELGDDPEEAQRLLEKAKEIAEKYSPERVFDIETRRTLSFFNGGDIDKFLEGYQAYRQGVAEGKSSVHGRTIEVYYLACMGKTDEAVELAKKNLGEDSGEVITKIYEMAGRWKEAYESLRKETAANDSVNNVVLINSMAGVREQLTLHDVERKTTRNRMIALTIGILLLALLVAALSYIVMARRRHMRQLKRAYDHALESDKMKSAFIRNVTHEVRTPLNIISGFSQVIADPELVAGPEERAHIAEMMQKNTQLITSLVDEMLELSLNENTPGKVAKDDSVEVNDLIRDFLQENEYKVSKSIKLQFESSLDEDFRMQTNEEMLKRVVSLLFDNAIKYTKEGSITLMVSADDEQVTLAVEDTGTGIPTKEAETIFDRFVKLDTFKEGLGLGLPLCRMIVNRLGGTVNLDTSYKGGARFIVKLNR
ncbi:MAG: HAMP domain-containing histidine kinase [Prevotella sp.]|nr:HAMP domain-containing histidine kinase [Prevotella sp.]